MSKLYPNPLRRPIQLGRYDQVIIEVLRAEILPPRPHVHAVITLNDVKYTTKVSTQGQNPDWSNERVTAPLFQFLEMEIDVFHGDELLGITRIPVNRMLQFPEGICTLYLCIPDIALEDPSQYQSSITLRATQLPPFIANSFPQYHLREGSNSCSLPHGSILATSVFHPSADSVRRILKALEGAPLANPVAHNVLVISESLVVKVGGRGHSVREAMAMMYVRQQTSIPVPEVHMCFEHDGATYIVMDRLKGRCFQQALYTATSQHLRGFATQLAGFIRELRALDPRTMMGSWPTGPYDNLLFDPPPLHEFRDIKEFHSYWIWRLGSDMCLPEVPPALRDADRPCRVVLTHGDLAPRNIMVDGEKITGLVDWETLGWYPDFWESMAATRSLGTNMDKWIDELSAQLGPLTDSVDQYVSVLHDVFFRPWAE